MKSLTGITLGIFLSLFSAPLAYAAFSDPYLSRQVGTSPSNTYILQTDGTNSTWVAPGTLGIGGGGSSFPFSTDTNFAQTVYSTSTPTLWFKSGLFASSTSWFSTLNILNALGVASGGTGSSTLSGLLKGTGTAAVQTAVPNTDYQLPITLTTTGSSGAATFNGTTLNIPNYSFTSASSTLLGDNNTFSGTNTFSNPIVASITGNAATATKLLTARAINGVNFDGTADITVFAASSTLLGDNNTFGGTSRFSSAPIFSTLTGLLKGNGASALTVASNGTDYTLITAKTCTAGDFVSAVTAAGVFTCTTPTASGGAAFPFTPTNYGVATGTTVGFTQGLLSAASSTFTGDLFLPTLSQGLLFNGTNGITKTVATTSATCSGTITCSAFTVLGSSPITLNGSAGTSASSTLLSDDNTWSGINNFATATFPGGSYIIPGEIFLSPDGAAGITFSTAVSAWQSGPGTQIEFYSPLGRIFLSDTSSKGANLDFNTSDADKIFTFPNETGTFALGTGSAGNCATWSSANTLTHTGAPCGAGGGGSGNVATSTTETAGQLPYWTTTGGTPATLGSIATTSHSFSGPFTITGTIGALVGGSNSTITWNGLATTSQPSSSNLLVSNGGAGVYGVATSTLTAGSGLSGSFTQIGSGGSVACATANGSTFGCLTSTDWNTFNGKESALTFNWPLIRSTNTISFGGLSTSSALAAGGAVLYATGVNTLASVATSTLTAGTGLTFSGTPGFLVGGTNLTIHGVGYPFGGTGNSTSTLTRLLGGATTTDFSANTLAVGGTGTTSISATGALTAPTFTLTGITSGLHGAGVNGLTYSAATSSITAGTGVTFSGTPGALVGGTALTIHGIGYPFPSNATTTVVTFTNGASVSKLTNLTSNGFVKTSGSDGTLSVDTNTYATFGWPFTTATTYGTTTFSTTTPLWLKTALYASSTVLSPSIIDNLVTTNSTSTNATTTNFNVSGQLKVGTGTGLLLTTSGVASNYAGVTCTNQFLRALSASGASTCATVGAADVSLANLTATDSTLTFSGTYTGATARTIGLNLGNANTWTALQNFGNASSTQLSVPNQAWFGSTATTTITSAGWLGIATSSPWKALSVFGDAVIKGTSSATSTIYVNSTDITKGGRIILKDVNGTTCTEITTLSGSINSKAVTCP